MLTNNYLFDLYWYFLRWKSERAKLLLLTLGYVFLFILLMQLATLAGVLLKRSPAWANVTGPYYTVAKRFEDGSLAGTNLMVADAIKQYPGVKEISYLALHNITLTSALGEARSFKAVFYSRNLVRHLGLTFSKQAQSNGGSGVYLTHRLAQQANGQAARVTSLSISNRGINIPVEGIADDAFDMVGSEPVDIWLPVEYFVHFTPFAGGPMASRFMRAVPIFFIFFDAAKALDETAFLNYLHENTKSVAGIQFEKRGAALALYRGIILDAQAYQYLWQNAIAIGIFVLILALTLSVVSLMFHVKQAIVLHADTVVVRVLGGTRWRLIRPLVLGNLVVLVVIGGLGLWGYGPAMHWLLAFGLQANVPTMTTGEVSLGTQTFAFAVVAVLLMGTAIVPQLKWTQWQLFQRAVSVSLSRRAQHAMHGLQLAQLTLAVVALSFVAAFFLQQSDNRQQYHVDESVVVRHYQSNNASMPLKTIYHKGVSLFGNCRFAISETSFNQPYRIAIEDARLIGSAQFFLHYVSPSFFALVTGSDNCPQSDRAMGYFMNGAAVRRFQQGAEGLARSPLSLGKLRGQYRMVGVVPEIPHFGRQTAVPPMIYLPIEAADRGTIDNLYVYIGTHNPQTLAAFDQWLKQQAVGMHLVSEQTLQELLAQQEAPRQLFFVLTAILVTFAALLVGVSLSLQIASQVQAEKFTYGVLQALGASKPYIYWHAMKTSLFVLAASVALAWAVHGQLSGWYDEVLGVTRSNAEIGGLIGVSVLSVIACLSPLAALRRLFRTSIATCLRAGAI